MGRGLYPWQEVRRTRRAQGGNGKVRVLAHVCEEEARERWPSSKQGPRRGWLTSDLELRWRAGRVTPSVLYLYVGTSGVSSLLGLIEDRIKYSI